LHDLVVVVKLLLLLVRNEIGVGGRVSESIDCCDEFTIVVLMVHSLARIGDVVVWTRSVDFKVLYGAFILIHLN